MGTLSQSSTYVASVYAAPVTCLLVVNILRKTFTLCAGQYIRFSHEAGTLKQTLAPLMLNGLPFLENHHLHHIGQSALEVALQHMSAHLHTHKDMKCLHHVHLHIHPLVQE